ncbi:hypothetical protein [Calothrix rhizosoleniae]|uniref:hypothetical protein n=1 Tax=Calothrix rhizosoleniae TaxID=888997 RepID=UPI000B499BDE|nr:hypothetical protein [Calothrix rhizosoleniae]
MSEQFLLKQFSYYSHSSQRWVNDLLVVDANTQDIRGFFIPPRPGEVYVKVYKPEDILNLQDFPEHTKIKFFEIYPLNLSPDWQELGFTVELALQWKVTTQLQAELALAWKNAGFAPEEIKSWYNFGAKEPVVARRLLELGLQAQDIKVWGIKPAEIVTWVEQGFDAQTAKKWHKQGISPVDARTWQSENVTPEDVVLRNSLEIRDEIVPPRDVAILFWGFDFPEKPDIPPVPWEILGDKKGNYGCKVDFYGKPANISFFYIGVEESELRIHWSNEIYYLSPPQVKPEWEESLRSFCQEMNIKWQEPGWHLAALWESS